MSRSTRRFLCRSAGSALVLALLTAATCPDSPVGPVVPSFLVTAPQGVTVTSGAAATFSVTVTGTGVGAVTGPVTYQWLRDSVTIVGATSQAFVLPATVPKDSGAVFRVVVSNGGASVTSDGAVL